MKKSLYIILATFILTACSQQPAKEEAPQKEITVEEETITPTKKGRVVQFVKIKTNLSEEEFFEAAHTRTPRFKAIDGIIQKYYLRLENEGEYGGIYIWDSMESLQEFKQSDLAKTIGEAYGVIGKPSVEVHDILFQLRDK